MYDEFHFGSTVVISWDSLKGFLNYEGLNLGTLSPTRSGETIYVGCEHVLEVKE